MLICSPSIIFNLPSTCLSPLNTIGNWPLLLTSNVFTPLAHVRLFLVSFLLSIVFALSVFRAHPATTHRHLTEFIALDLEMTFGYHYHEVLETIERLFTRLFQGLEAR